MMFQTVARAFPVSSISPVSRCVSFGVRRFCEKNPTKLRVSEALLGAEVGEDVRVQVKHLGLIFFPVT